MIADEVMPTPNQFWPLRWMKISGQFGRTKWRSDPATDAVQ
jgi:hypothetical protein